MTLSEFRSILGVTLSDFYSKNQIDQLVKSLLKHRLNLDSVSYLLSSELELSVEVIAQLRSDVLRLTRHEPLQYIIGSTSFYGLEIHCTPASLIPRPETEELVDWVLTEVTKTDCSVIDLGTGTGCIPLAVKSKRPAWQVSGVDISQEALNLACSNASRLGLDVSFSILDLMGDFSNQMFDAKFNIVVSNPPYIPQSEASAMLLNVLNHEPHLALFVPDSNPLIFYHQILMFCKHFLEINGYVFVEIHEEFSEKSLQLFINAGFSNIELRKDLQGKTRMIKAQLVSLSGES